MLAGEQVIVEEAKQERRQIEEKKVGLFDVAKVNWDYFSPENVV